MLEKQKSLHQAEVENDIENEGFDLPDDAPGMARRDTFVGTPLYVSPEMLQETRSTPASDLWALGCIIYFMLVGKTPFEDRSETKTFDNILNRTLEFPEEADLSHEAKDLIDRLLKVNPIERLGAGRPGSDNDLWALKTHPYFAGIDFSLLEEAASPLGELPEKII